MAEQKPRSVWALVLYTVGAIISLIGVPMALHDRRYLEAGFWLATLLACLTAAIENRRRTR